MTLLQKIIAERNLTALEAYAIRMQTYENLINEAKKQGVDLGELEELLYEIS